jgi:hypothetical protein
LIEISKGRKFDLHLRGLHELCSWGAKEGLQKLRHVYQVSYIIIKQLRMICIAFEYLLTSISDLICCILNFVGNTLEKSVTLNF